MLKSHILRYSFGLLSEIVYHGYRALIEWYNHRSNNMAKQKSVVIWSNGSVQSCSEKHDVYSNSQKNKESFDKIQIMERGSGCSNPYCMTSNIGLLVDLVNATRYTVDIAMNTFTAFEISSALLNASKRGVVIRIISDREMAYSTSSQIFQLEKSGIAVRCNTNSTSCSMHHKFCLLDSPSTIKNMLKGQAKILSKKELEETMNEGGVLMTGSLNWTAQGFNGNFENVMLTNQKKIIQKYSHEFQRMWELFDHS